MFKVGGWGIWLVVQCTVYHWYTTKPRKSLSACCVVSIFTTTVNICRLQNKNVFKLEVFAKLHKNKLCHNLGWFSPFSLGAFPPGRVGHHFHPIYLRHFLSFFRFFYSLSFTQKSTRDVRVLSSCPVLPLCKVLLPPNYHSPFFFFPLLSSLTHQLPHQLPGAHHSTEAGEQMFAIARLTDTAPRCSQLPAPRLTGAPSSCSLFWHSWHSTQNWTSQIWNMRLTLFFVLMEQFYPRTSSCQKSILNYRFRRHHSLRTAQTFHIPLVVQKTTYFTLNDTSHFVRLMCLGELYLYNLRREKNKILF